MNAEAATAIVIVVLMPVLFGVLLVSEAVHAGFLRPPGGPRRLAIVRAVLLLAFVAVVAVRLVAVT